MDRNIEGSWEVVDGQLPAGHVLRQVQGAIPHDQLADGAQMTFQTLLAQVPHEQIVKADEQHGDVG